MLASGSLYHCSRDNKVRSGAGPQIHRCVITPHHSVDKRFPAGLTWSRGHKRMKKTLLSQDCSYFRKGNRKETKTEEDCKKLIPVQIDVDDEERKTD